MAEKIKVFEEKKSQPIWVWLLPLLVLLIAIVVYFQVRNRAPEVVPATPATTAAPQHT